MHDVGLLCHLTFTFYFVVMFSPIPEGMGRYNDRLVRPSVRTSIRTSVRHKSGFRSNLATFRFFNKPSPKCAVSANFKLKSVVENK